MSIPTTVVGVNTPNCTDDAVEIGYRMGGLLLDPEEPESLAKSVHHDDKTTYYIKVATSGGDAGKLVNPNSVNHSKDDFNRVDRFGRQRYDYRRVTREVFEHYQKFLEAGNLSWLRNAERLRINK